MTRAVSIVPGRPGVRPGLGGSLAYAQARIQARYAELPGEGEWLRLGSARSLSAWLEEARGGALKPWVKGFAAQSAAPDIERGVRALFIETADETARLLPARWQPAVAWCRWLPLLPLLAHLRDGRPPPAWVGADFRLAGWLTAAGAVDDDRLRALGLAPLLRAAGPLAADQRRRVRPAPAAGSGQRVGARGAARSLMTGLGDADQIMLAAWTAHWLALWPATTGHDAARLLRLAGRLAAHLVAFAAAAPGQTWPLRRQLRESLRLDFHRHLMQPAAAFIYLALVALDLERLRRGLLDRALYPGVPLAVDPDAPLAAVAAGSAGAAGQPAIGAG